MRSITFILLALYLTSCSFYGVNTSVLPDVEMPQTYRELPSVEVKNDIVSGPWWYALSRDDLNQLIESGLQSNFEVKQYLAAVKQARSLEKSALADFFPKISGVAGSQNTWEKGETDGWVTEFGGEASWEVDVFGRINYQYRSKKFDLLSEEAAFDGMRLMLSAEIAKAYFGSVASQRTLRLLEQQLTLDSELLELLELRFENGVGTNVAVLQQKSRVAETESLFPVAQADRRLYENRMDILLGELPDGQDRIKDNETLAFSEELPPLDIPVNLIMNRPDLRILKADLLSADASIGEAISERLPKISLTGSLLYEHGTSLSGMVSHLAGQFVMPLLEWGKRKAKVEEKEALYEERLAEFTHAFLKAVEEVENILYLEDRQRDYLERLRKRKEILEQTVSETEARYREGVDDYLGVINALQELRSVERNLIRQEYQLIQYRIQLFQAIGAPTDLPNEKDET